MKSILIVAALSLLGAAGVRADTTYNMTFTNSIADPVIGNGSGTFTINSADVVTSMNFSFPVLEAYSYAGASGTPGEILTFTNITSPANGIVTYDPSTQMFGSGTNYRFELEEFQPGDPNNGAFLIIDGGEPILENEYGVGDIGDGEFGGQFNPNGTWLITAASTPITGPTTGAPEPGSVGLALTGFGAACLIIRRRKAHSA